MTALREATLTPALLAQLLELSRDWEAEGSCTGYRANAPDDILGNRVFVAEAEGRVVGYLFGSVRRAEHMSSVMAEGAPCFEVEELYVRPERRSAGIGTALFCFAEAGVKEEAQWIVLSTATKNWRAVLHFYIDELGMDFWHARLYKAIQRE